MKLFGGDRVQPQARSSVDTEYHQNEMRYTPMSPPFEIEEEEVAVPRYGTREERARAAEKRAAESMRQLADG